MNVKELTFLAITLSAKESYGNETDQLHPENSTEQTSAQELYELGICYENGEKGKKHDDWRAAKYYQLAADLGHAGAQFNLGWLYYNKIGVIEDNSHKMRALELFKKAANSGYDEAEYFFSWLHEDCYKWGMSQKAVIHMFHRDAKNGHNYAKRQLGFMYYTGTGVNKNIKKAAEFGHTTAQYELKIISDTMNGYNDLYTSATDQKLAEDHLKAGTMYYNGDGVPKNYDKALTLFKLAADQGHAEAQYNLGIMYDNGHGVPKNYDTAVKFYKLAADQGLVEAQKNLDSALKNRGKNSGGLLVAAALGNILIRSIEALKK